MTPCAMMSYNQAVETTEWGSALYRFLHPGSSRKDNPDMASIWNRIQNLLTLRRMLSAAAVIALGLAALYPMWFGVLATRDGSLHLIRLLGLEHAARAGSLWPRFVPGLAYGYGLPLFNFDSPISLYPALIIQAVGGSPARAITITSGLYLLVAMGGAAVLGREMVNDLTGLAVSVGVGYAPYLLVMTWQVGALDELAGLAMLPWALWGALRAIRRGGTFDLIAGTVAISLLVLMHRPTAAVSLLPLLIVAAVAITRAENRRPALVRAGVLAAFVLLLTAFYWLPALLESRLVVSGGFTDPALDIAQVRGLRSLFTLWPQYELFSMSGESAAPISVLALVMTAAGLTLALLRRSGPLDTWTIVFGSLAAGLLLFAMPFMAPVYDRLYLFRLIGQPVRLLGVGAVLLGVSQGLALIRLVDRFKLPELKSGLAVLGFVLMLIASRPHLVAAYQPRAADLPTTIGGAQALERRTGWAGGTRASDYLPLTMDDDLDPNRLAPLFNAGQIIPRLHPAEDVTVLEADWGTRYALLTLDVDEPTALVFDWLYFPGWRASVNLSPVPVVPTEDGLLAVQVPPGEVRLDLAFGPTLPRIIGVLISLTALAAGALLLTLGPARWFEVRSARRGLAQFDYTGLVSAMGVGVMGVIMLGLINGFDPPLGAGPDPVTLDPAVAVMGDVLQLESVVIANRSIPSGGTVDITLVWTLYGTVPDSDYASVVQIENSDGELIDRQVAYYPGGLPVRQWLYSPFYMPDTLTLTIPAGTPPDDLHLSIGLFSLAEGRNLNVFTADGVPLGVFAPAGTVRVLPPRQPLTLETLGIEGPIGVSMGDGLVLEAVEGLPEVATVGDSMPMAWVWSAEAAPGEDYRGRLAFLHTDGSIAAYSAAFDLSTSYRTSEWMTGDVWRIPHTFAVPGRLEAGTYDVAVDVMGLGVAPVRVGSMQVNVPNRTYEMPDSVNNINLQWNNGITLIGYDLANRDTAGGQPISLTLYWRTSDDVLKNLTAFVHLVKDNGQIVSQRDAYPLDGARPTAGWAPGEIIADSITLETAEGILAGEYRLRIGWYDGSTGERVRLRDGAEFTFLPITVQITE